MRHTNPTLDSQDLVPHSMPGSPVSIYPASTRLSRIKIDTVVAVLCSTVLCLSTARVMVASQWPATPEARPPAVDIELDSDGDELFLKVSTIEISTPMVVHSV